MDSSCPLIRTDRSAGEEPRPVRQASHRALMPCPSKVEGRHQEALGPQADDRNGDLVGKIQNFTLRIFKVQNIFVIVC